MFFDLTRESRIKEKKWEKGGRSKHVSNTTTTSSQTAATARSSKKNLHEL
jgi:hypothetical protein